MIEADGLTKEYGDKRAALEPLCDDLAIASHSSAPRDCGEG